MWPLSYFRSEPAAEALRLVGYARGDNETSWDECWAPHAGVEGAPFVLVVDADAARRDAALASIRARMAAVPPVQAVVCGAEAKAAHWDDALVGQREHCQWSLHVSKTTVDYWCRFDAAGAIVSHRVPRAAAGPPEGETALTTVDPKMVRHFCARRDKIDPRKRLAPVLWGVHPSHVPAELRARATHVYAALDCAAEVAARLFPDAPNLTEVAAWRDAERERGPGRYARHVAGRGDAPALEVVDVTLPL